MPVSAPEQQLAGFIDKFTPPMAAFIRAARQKMRQRLPRAVELVYDNYNFFVIGYGPGERASEAIFSLAAHAKGLALCFLQGAGLPDPHGLLRGSGNVVRSVRLESASDLDRPEVRALMAAALERAKVPLDPRGAHRLVIKSISAKQRPRRPAEPRAAARAAAGKPAAVRPGGPAAKRRAAPQATATRKSGRSAGATPARARAARSRAPGRAAGPARTRTAAGAARRRRDRPAGRA